eukprot:gene6222-2839_t
MTFKGCKFSKAATILLRGANDYILDEMDRLLHDSLCVVKRVLGSCSLVPGGGAVKAALSIFLEHLAKTLGSREQFAIGGGAVEAALSIFLEHFATTLGSREQLAIGEFANAALTQQIWWQLSGRSTIGLRQTLRKAGTWRSMAWTWWRDASETTWSTESLSQL